MAIIVTDTSPVRCVAHLRLLEILPKLFGTVLIPPAVADELRAFARGISPVDPAAMSFFEIRAPTNTTLVERLMTRLHAGESQALALTVEVRPQLVLIDEKTGRAVAKELGLVPMGVLGALVRAKRSGLINSVSPLVATLKRELDFRVSAEVERRILALAGE